MTYLTKNSFTAGEISPRLYARSDTERYANGCKTMRNCYPIQHGPVTRRPGFRFIADTRDSAKASLLMPFEFSTTQAYILEFGEYSMRVFKDRAQVVATASITGATQANPVVITATDHGFINGDKVEIAGVAGMTELNGNTCTIANAAANTFELEGIDGTAYGAYVSGGTATGPYSITTPYPEADIAGIKYCQSADILYLAHENHAPRMISRTGHTTWTLDPVPYTNGPWLAQNTAAITLAPSATTGAITITASASLFAATDVGRLASILHGSTWGVARITGYTSETSVSATVEVNFGAITATAEWRLGAWSDTTGWPHCVQFYQERLGFARTKAEPQTSWYSKTGDYYDFGTSVPIVDDDACTYTISSDKVNAINWIMPIGADNFYGATGAEYSLSGGNSNIITPANKLMSRESSFGCADIQPLSMASSMLFVQRGGKTVRSAGFSFESDGYSSVDLSIFSEHLTRNNAITGWAYQQTPQPIVWCVRDDGALLGMTFNKEHQVVAWHVHDTDGFFESVAGIPGAGRDELWVVVRRTVNGVSGRYIELLAGEFTPKADTCEDAFYVDSGLSFHNSSAITGVTQANPVVVSAPGHGLANGATVYISEVAGMTALNDREYTAANVTADTFELSGVDGTGFAAYGGGGTAEQTTGTVSGLDHLEGKSVNALCDGMVRANLTVAAGRVSFSTRFRKIHVGLPYCSDVEPVVFNYQDERGETRGRVQSAAAIVVRFHETVAPQIGPAFHRLENVLLRTPEDPMGEQLPLFSGNCRHTLDGGYTREPTVCVRQDKPLPMTILAMSVELNTYER